MDIRSKVLTALRWTAAARFLGQLVSWLITIFVIRLLSPGDYGLMAMAVVISSFLVLINTIGLDAVLIQKRNLDEFTRRQIFGAIVSVNLFFFVLLLVTAPAISDFYNEPKLEPIIRVLAFQFVFLIFETIPQTRLEREIDFKRLSLIDFITLLVGSVTTFALALAGMGVWALVWGTMVNTLSRVIGFNIISPGFIRPSFSIKGMREIFAFGGFVSVDRGLWFFFSEADKLIGGKMLGKDLLGLYAVANHLASLPIQKLAGLINAVAFPAFSHVQSDTRKVGEYALKATRMMSLIAFPVFLGISSIAAELIDLLLGKKWQEVVPLLMVLGFVMPLRMVGNILPPLLWGVGRPDISATNFLIASLLLPAALYIGTGWGALGMCYAWLLVYPVIFVITIWRAAPVVGLEVRHVLSAMIPSALAGGGMFIIVDFVRGYALGSTGDVLHLAQLVVFGVVAYVGLIALIHREGLREVLDLVKK